MPLFLSYKNDKLPGKENGLVYLIPVRLLVDPKCLVK
jgi:hypothetical protein